MAKNAKKDTKKPSEDVQDQETTAAANASDSAKSTKETKQSPQTTAKVKKSRVEQDLIGEMEVPNSAYYGVHTMRAMDNFQISYVTINSIPEFIRGMAQVKKAAAMANRRLHTLPKKKAEAIMWACDQILEEGRCMDQFPLDVFQGGAGTSVNMNTNEVIANLALEYLGEEKGAYDIINPNDDVNMSQSTNDAYPTGFRLGLYASIDQLIERMDALQNAFSVKANEFQDILKMGRTQLQDAVPMTLGDEFKAFAHNLQEEQSVLRDAQARLLEINMGATAIGTGVNTPAGYRHQVTAALSEVTGLEMKTARDLIEATSDCGAYVLLHSAIKRAAMKLSKISNDLRLLSSGPRAGLNEINLPARQAGSSIMPGKVNPVIPEVVNQVCFKVFGNDITVNMAAEAGQLQLNVMEPVIGEALFQSIRIMGNAVDTLREKCVQGITANKDVCRHYVESSIGIVTYLNPFIGHHNGDLIAKESLETGKGVRDLVLEKGLLDEATLDRVLSVENLMHPEFRGKLYMDEN
ncbi:aspartate ammonia-lyase [Corynebacterium sp. HMSC04H06]|uniref:aspartate ammonia-lyase n=1 Tax=Corynebacterium sp. HMSC04H06 TaxID=1581050 RepID=UPI0008A5540C|nr:aspartate ammonia-lyase [Corynebacterium sp. HMSC04H06]OFS23204.1 aspartate ammonia-lyase [Corynebacterium sp. HMSC04H06]